MVRYLEVKTQARTDMVDITGDVQGLVRQAGVEGGICHLFTLHTTAGLTINEGADPAVRQDMIGFLDRLVPQDVRFRHDEGNSDAHIKSTLTGVSLTVIIEGGKLLLGTWQSIYFCEYDGPRRRKVVVKIIG